MASIVTQHLDENVLEALKVRAERNGHTVEDETRASLTRAVRTVHTGQVFIQLGQELGGIEDCALPDRNYYARAIDFGDKPE